MKWTRAILGSWCMVIAVTVAGAGDVAEWGVAVFPSGAEFNLEIRVSDDTRIKGGAIATRLDLPFSVDRLDGVVFADEL